MLPITQLLTDAASQCLPVVTGAAVLLVSVAVSVVLCGGGKKVRVLASPFASCPVLSCRFQAQPVEAPKKDSAPPTTPDQKAAPDNKGDEEKQKSLDAAQDKPKSTDGRLQPKSAFGA